MFVIKFLLFCSVVALAVAELSFPKTCLKPFESGTCQEKQVVYAFETKYGRCYRALYSGCGGNENRFSTLQECIDTCISVPDLHDSHKIESRFKEAETQNYKLHEVRVDDNLNSWGSLFPDE